MGLEHAGEYGSQWGAISSIAGKIGCSAETLRRWVRQAERDEGSRPGPTSADRTRIRKLERENRELRQANEILRKASAYFAQAELDRSEEHTSELQSLMRISYAVFCLKKKQHKIYRQQHTETTR